MAKIGRNDSCPCGSGKKYKKCCAVAAPMPTDVATTEPLCECCVDELNDRVDRVLALILEHRVDDAEILCHQLLTDFPHDAEGIDLLSMICEARGELRRALELLRQASDIAHARPDYDDETRMLMRTRIKEHEASLRLERRPSAALRLAAG